MVDVSGIPNMGFGGGGYFGGIPNQQPAMSAAQINAGMWGNYSPQQAQMTQASLYGPMGFGGQTAAYSALGAAYGRNTGYYGDTSGLPPGSAPRPGFNYNDAAGLSPSTAPNGGGYNAADPSTWAQQGWGAPRQYGWDTNEGAPAPPYTPPHPMGQFNPHTYGWDTNEGAPVPPPPDFNSMWVDRGAWGLGRDNLFNSYTTTTQPQQQQPGGLEWLYQQMGLPAPFTSPQHPNAGAGWGGFDSGMNLKGNPYRDLIMNYAPEPIQGDTGQLFDSIKYLRQNPDVLKAGMSGYEHYDKFGRGEGREATWGNVFDPQTYLRTNQDVQQAGVDPRTHWLQYGQKEGRQGGGVLNETRDSIARLLTPGGGGGQFGGANTNTFGAGLQQPTLSVPRGSIYQDPFGGYVPSTAPGPGGLPANYSSRYDALPLGWNNPFGN